MNREEEIIKIIGDLVKRQHADTNRELRVSLEDSELANCDYPMVRCIVRQFMALAVQQYEERQFIFSQIAKGISPNVGGNQTGNI